MEATELSPRAAALVDAFAAHLRLERGLSEHTVRAYTGDLVNLFGHLARVGDGDPADVSLGDLRTWLANQYAAGADRATLQRRAAGARTFFAWAARTGRLPADPAQALRSPKVDRRLPATVEADQARKALDALAARPEGDGIPLLSLTAAARRALPTRELSAPEARAIGFGQPVQSTAPAEEAVAAFAPDGHLLAVIDQRLARARTRIVFPIEDS